MTSRDFAIAVTKFFYFSQNYPWKNITYTNFDGEHTEYLPSFLDADWHCNKAHIISKWKSACIKKYDEDGYPIHNDSYGVVNRFFAELDGNNRMALLEWVNENYDHPDDFGICLPKEEEVATA